MPNISIDNRRIESRSIYLKSNPIVGLLALTGFVDDSNDPIGARVFQKTFRYTTNGVTYSEWLPLTLQAITSIQVDPTDVFILQISYLKDEPTGDSLLDVTEATLAVNQSLPDDPVYFKNSLFAKHFGFNNTEVLNWYVNVLEKMYEKGLIPSYIERNVTDYLAVWGSVCRFFAFYVQYARTFATFYNKRDLIEDFIQQRGLNISPEDTLLDCQFILETFHHQYAKRGTVGILDDKEQGTSVSGELRRLIHKKVFDEFIFCLYEPHHFGWNLRNSSPLYRGLRNVPNINKVQWSFGELSMSQCLPFVTSGVASLVVEEGKDVLRLTNGTLISSESDKTFFDPKLDYEISFRIKIESSTTFVLTAFAWDKANDLISFKSRKDDADTTTIISNGKLNRIGEWIEVRAYVYNENRPVFNSDATNIKQGNNLKSPVDLQTAQFALSIDGTAEIKDFKIAPIMTEYSRGFVQVQNFISLWLKNRNLTYSKRELEDYIKKYLVPYNSHLKLTNIGDYLYQVGEEAPDTTFWIGAGEYCQKVAWIGIDPTCEIEELIWVPDEDTSYCEQTN